MPGQERLKNSVIEKNLCSGCGMCVGLCPYIKTIRDRVGVIHNCGLDDGTCYQACPKTFLDVAKMDSVVFGKARKDHALGVYRDICFARAPLGRPAGAQYGGVTSALLGLALERGLIEGAVLTGGTSLEPRAVVARKPEDVMSCAGSKYTAVPTLSAFNEAVRDGLGRLGLAGRPCQIEAVRKVQAGSCKDAHLNREKAVAVTVGLFCFWSLEPGYYDYLSQKASGAEVIKVDIPQEGLAVTTGQGSFIYPVEEIRPYIKDSCNLCIDSTSEWADLSVGSTEFDPGWNTLIVRTEAGQSLLDMALEAGIVEVRPYPEERLPILRKAALNKKMRVLGAGGGKKPEYLAMPGEYLSEIKKQWEALQ